LDGRANSGSPAYPLAAQSKDSPRNGTQAEVDYEGSLRSIPELLLRWADIIPYEESRPGNVTRRFALRTYAIARHPAATASVSTVGGCSLGKSPAIDHVRHLLNEDEPLRSSAASHFVDKRHSCSRLKPMEVPDLLGVNTMSSGRSRLVTPFNRRIS